MKHLVVLVALIAVTSAQIKTAIIEDDDQYRAISSQADSDQDTIGKFLMITMQEIVEKKKPNVVNLRVYISRHTKDDFLEMTRYFLSRQLCNNC